MTVIVTRKPEALSTIISAYKEFAQNVSDTYQKEIQELENKLSGL